MENSVDPRVFCDKVLAHAKSLGADYADIRIVHRDFEYTQVKTGKVENLESTSDYGFGVRVLYDGAWGFSSSPRVDDQDGLRVADEAVRIARASASTKRQDVKLAPVDVYEGTFKSDLEIDPFDVPLDEKIGLLKDADSIIRQNEKIKVTDCTMEFWKFNQVFASTDGSYIEQSKVESGAGISATAIEGSEVQTRSYPGAMGGDYRAAGYEFVKSLELIEHAEQVANEAASLLSAPVCPSGEHTIILDSGMLALQVHESCGHPIELDRVFGMESSYAGTSFLTTDKLGTFHYGSDVVNITADATIPGALGSFAFDDEGVPGQRVEIVNQGVFNGYLTSRETAAEMGWTSGGAMRADGWDRIPIIRMTNINLLPGDWNFDELIADTPDGLYMVEVKSWSIDDKRLNFQFGTEIAWEIKDGSLGRVLKNPIYSGITPQFWNSCDAICNEDEWHVWGVPNCGKGEPMQSAHVGHGVAASRFRNVKTEGAQ
ncbi:MAG: TldD/PmbA family protein [Armatimonadota bacterium]|nr:TldD/PmbA family protein [bacterium]